jgi:hypothetical protein
MFRGVSAQVLTNYPTIIMIFVAYGGSLHAQAPRVRSPRKRPEFGPPRKRSAFGPLAKRPAFGPLAPRPRGERDRVRGWSDAFAG